MKKLLCLLALILLTGCTVKYDLVITNKQEVREKIYVYVDESVVKANSMNMDEYLDYYSNLYIQNDNYKDFNISIKKGKQAYILAKNDYKTLDDYILSYSFKNLFNNAKIERVGKYTSFTTTTNLFLENIKNDMLISEDSKNNNYEINVKFYNEVVNHNADKVDKKNNVYTWNINKDIEKDYIYFKIGPKVKYDVMVKDYIENNLLSISIISGLFLFILIASSYIYIKIKKNNEI